jgi:hypothetical protein
MILVDPMRTPAEGKSGNSVSTKPATLPLPRTAASLPKPDGTVVSA